MFFLKPLSLVFDHLFRIIYTKNILATKHRNVNKSIKWKISREKVKICHYE